MTVTTKTLKKSRPNGFHIRLEVVDEGGEYQNYYVVESGDEDGVEFDGQLDKAEAYYEERCADLAKTPNWEAQARYDEQHGTVNGYSPWQFTREE